MSRFIKKAAKGSASLGGSALKQAISGVLGDIAKEIIEETGVANVAKEKIMEAGFKVFTESGFDVKNLQRDLFKQAIMKEMKL